MKFKKIKNLVFFVCAAATLGAPFGALALDMPKDGNELAEVSGISAQAYVVADLASGQILMSKNPDMLWSPASLTKLVTALVVLDTKPNLKKSVAMTDKDQQAGACKSGGACIKTKAGVKFTVDGLFHAALMPSANNAALALARSTGLSDQEFVARMNDKVRSLGGLSSHFNEPTGLDPSNQITAGDYLKILREAFSNKYLASIAGRQKFLLRSSNNSRYNQTIKNTNKLLADSDIEVLGAKTGYLDESKYNFASLVKYRGQDTLAIVVLGEDHLYTAFAETKLLASLGQTAQTLALQSASQPEVLGASTTVPSGLKFPF